MTDTSPILAMPYIQPSQAQKHVTHNEALSLLDVIVQLAVESAVLATPPATAVEGDRYIVAANGQAAWAGHDHRIATFVSGAWMFTAPKAGWVAQVVESGAEVIFDGTVWAARSLSNLPGVGIGASYDGYNRLVVSSDAVLLNNAGAGHQLRTRQACCSKPVMAGVPRWGRPGPTTFRSRSVQMDQAGQRRCGLMRHRAVSPLGCPDGARC